VTTLPLQPTQGTTSVIIGVGSIRYATTYGSAPYVVDKTDCEVDTEIYSNVKAVNPKSSGGTLTGTTPAACAGVTQFISPVPVTEVPATG